MAISSSPYINSGDSLYAEVLSLIDRLPNDQYGKWIERSLSTIVRLAGKEIDRLDWKILSASLHDMERAFQLFYPYRHVRKVTVFGSARVPETSPEYKTAFEFARYVTREGFMVMTGGGGGIMQAGNEGAGSDSSFGLNIYLPFEQGANPYITDDSKLIEFKYFFTRKLFFLRESDAVALFPGGFGTQDEAFECITLSQTGRFGPVPVILIDPPGGDYWQDWNAFVNKQLVRRGLVSPADTSIYTITDNLNVACEAIKSFYRVYHSSRYVQDKFVIRLKCELSDEAVEQLNDNFGDILVKGKIEKSAALPKEVGDETLDLPRLVLYFNQRDLGRLYQLIAAINQLGASSLVSCHPEKK
jgi:uncharacterized protein (TIGR00730 family)